MSKILIVKGIEKCKECPWHHVITNEDAPDDLMCVNAPNIIDVVDSIPTWCPLPDEEAGPITQMINKVSPGMQDFLEKNVPCETISPLTSALNDFMGMANKGLHPETG